VNRQINSSLNGLRTSSGGVFLLSLPATVNDDVHAMFRQWVQSLGCNVFDVLDPELVNF
jgi:hypothetical protein